MVANKIFCTFCMVLLFMPGLYAKEDITTQDYVEKNLNKSLVLLGDKIRVCREKEEKNPLEIVPKSLQESNITVEDFQIATKALNYTNNTLCIEKEMNHYMYHALIVYKLLDGNIDNKEILDSVLISLPSKDIVQAIAKYESFPSYKKEYFQKNIGSTPFDIVKISLPILKAFRK